MVLTNDEGTEMIETIEDAQHELAAAEQDAIADHGEDVDFGYDLVVGVAWNCTDEVARELCRRELGLIPYDLEARLGRKDWLDL